MSTYDHGTITNITAAGLDEAVSPGGLHAEEPEPDFSEQHMAQEAAAEERAPITHNQDSSRGALRDVAAELSRATTPETKSKLQDIQKKLGANVDKLLSNLPKKIAKANLTDSVKALTALVPLMAEVDTLLTPRKSPQELLEDIRKRAQKKIAKNTRSRSNGSDTPAD